jgi:LPXTG-site transpeptidase (sortase) family protein
MLERPFSFAFTFLALFALVFAFMWETNALPNVESGWGISTHTALLGGNGSYTSSNSNNNQSGTANSISTSNPAYPTRVVASSIGLDVKVVNPATTSVSALDSALESGAVRYPTSALLGQDGTVLLFGHSSYLPVVYHQYYKTFDGIQNLKAGQTVSVFADGTEYRYAVSGVTLANAEQDVIQLPQSGKHLILVTCDSFATKSTRYVVRADFVGAYEASR